MSPVLVLVLGGTRSGKSELAERLVARAGAPVTYVATGRRVVDTNGAAVEDLDMVARIAGHRARRPAHWRTAEVGDAPPDALAEVLRSAQGAVLVDSLGTWVAGHPDFAVDVEALCRGLRERQGDTVVVSDEVGLGVHPSTETGRRFRDALGEVNRAVADVADRVLLVVAGRALALPGATETLPG
jgi:adenosyl cobinamide kinase/adenosyl cobinamide phosphate guanylyltransferase